MSNPIKYRAIVLTGTGGYLKEFTSLGEAERWLDSENNNYERTTIIETFEGDKKIDSFYYTTAK